MYLKSQSAPCFSPAGTYRGLLDALVTIAKTEGPMVLYRGLGTGARIHYNELNRKKEQFHGLKGLSGPAQNDRNAAPVSVHCTDS
jgi:hypothetical protein